MVIEMKKTRAKMNRPIYLGISKSHMHVFLYDSIKLKHQDKAKLCYTDTGSFIIHIKTEDFYQHIVNDVEK